MTDREAQDRIAETLLDIAGIGPERACACNACRACRASSVANALAANVLRQLRHGIAAADSNALWDS